MDKQSEKTPWVLIKKYKNAAYSEIGQNKRILFSFAKKEGNTIEVLFKPVQCRDYFSDILYVFATGKPVDVCGFKMDKKESEKINKDITTLYLSFTDPVSPDLFEKNLSVLHSIEKENHLRRTEVTTLSKHEKLIEGSSFWLKSTPLLSLYTFLLKCIAYDLPKSEDWLNFIRAQPSNEAGYAKCIPDLSKYLKNLRYIFEKTELLPYKGHENVNELHGMGGFVSVFTYDKISSYKYERDLIGSPKAKSIVFPNIYWERIMEIKNGQTQKS